MSILIRVTNKQAKRIIIAPKSLFFQITMYPIKYETKNPVGVSYQSISSLPNCFIASIPFSVINPIIFGPNAIRKKAETIIPIIIET